MVTGARRTVSASVRLWLLAACGATVLALGAGGAQAAGGTVDATFATAGVALTDVASSTDDAAYAVAVQNDKKIVAAGSSTSTGNSDFALARYLPTGVLDTTFGAGGTVLTPIGGTDEVAHAVAIQSDKKIVVAGTADSDIALARYLPTGLLDTTFGTGGTVTTSIGPDSDGASAVAIQKDKKIVVAGWTITDGNSDFALARYLKTGALDPTFGTGGTVTTNFGTLGIDKARALAIQSDGKILAVGFSSAGSVPGSGFDFAIARYTKYGVLDTTFGAGGVILTDLGSPSADDAYAVAIQKDGKTVVAGFTNAGGEYNIGIVRYTKKWVLDTTFGVGGIVLTDLGPSTDDRGYTLAVQQDGKILVGGLSNVNGSNDAAVVRYTKTGALDATFGTGGIALGDLGGSSNDSVNALALQKDGRIVAAGVSNAGGSNDFALIRYLAK